MIEVLSSDSEGEVETILPQSDLELQESVCTGVARDVQSPIEIMESQGSGMDNCALSTAVDLVSRFVLVCLRGYCRFFPLNIATGAQIVLSDSQSQREPVDFSQGSLRELFSDPATSVPSPLEITGSLKIPDPIDIETGQYTKKNVKIF